MTNLTYRRPLKVFVAIVLLIFTASCLVYRPRELPRDQPILLNPNRIIILHQDGSAWIVNNPEISEQQLRGNLSPVPYFVTTGSAAKSKKAEEVHLYVSADASLEGNESGRFSLAIQAIEKIEVYDVALGRTLFSWSAGGAAAFGAVFLFIALTKDSCPFVYAWDGQAYDFIGEIYSGAIYAQLERHDYLPLHSLVVADGEYRVRITNEVREIQHTNLIELLMVDHPPDMAVLIDKTGAPHTLANPWTPVTAVSLDGRSIAAVLAARDGDAYFARDDSADAPLMDGAILTFPRPQGAMTGKLVIHGKNSFWLDYIYGQFLDLFGDALPRWRETQLTVPSSQLHRWMEDQGLPLQVYLETGEGWEPVGTYDIIGPMAYKDDVVMIDLSRAHADTVRVKLEYGHLFWELDYVAMDFTPDFPLEVVTLPIVSATDQLGNDVAPFIISDDTLYHIQAHIGDQMDLTFASPPIPEGVARTTILHSKGHYEILRDPSGRPDRRYLETFRQPGRFIQFSNLRLKEALAQLE